MRHLVNAEGNVIYDQNEILNEQVKFYENLYTEEPIDICAKHDFLEHSFKVLPPADSEQCDEGLTANELKGALFAMKSNKSPGIDGLTVEFFQHFWWDFVEIFEKLINEIFQRNELCDSMKVGVLSLIPKKGDLTTLDNWRPISLLNIDYKIVSKALAKRITNVIHNLISDDQTCGIPGKDISENVVSMSLLIDYVKKNDINGLVLKIDQYKAFDRVNHEYLFSVIKKMGFGHNFQKWIYILYNNIQSCIKYNGYISDLFPIKRGVRQGCPISALLYVLSVEPFHDYICKDPHISGINIGITEAKIFQHADDTTFFVSNITSVYSILQVINQYERASGSKCNIEKTELLVIGRDKIKSTDFNFPVRRDFIEVLGITIGNNKNAIEVENWVNKVKSCKSLLRKWKGRKLSLKGKVLVVNSLIVSRLVYLISNLNVPEWVFNTLRTEINDFIWDGKKPLISYKSMSLPIEKGGL